MRRVAPFAVILLACSAEQSVAPGAADGWGPTMDERFPPKPQKAAPRALPIPVSQRKPWAHAEQLASFQAAGARSGSEHLDGLFERTVWVNPLAGAYTELTRGTAMPPGAIIVQRHHPKESDDVMASFVMERQDTGWRFLVLDAENRVAAHEHLELCARCHADAPYGGLFGLSPD